MHVATGEKWKKICGCNGGSRLFVGDLGPI